MRLRELVRQTCGRFEIEILRGVEFKRASFCLAYASGYILENMGVILYESESDQQRNFNIFIILSLVVSLVFGWLSVKYGLTKSSSGR